MLFQSSTRGRIGAERGAELESRGYRAVLSCVFAGEKAANGWWDSWERKGFRPISGPV